MLARESLGFRLGAATLQESTSSSGQDVAALWPRQPRFDFWRGRYSLSNLPFNGGAFLCCQDTLPEWSKGVDSSSTSASCVGSNPTGVILPLPSIAADSLAILARLAAAKQEATWPNG